MIYGKFLILSVFIFIAGCPSYGSGYVDAQLGSLIPRESALKVVNERLKLGDDLRLDARGFGSQSCQQLSMPGSVKDIRSAMYQTYASGHRILWLSLDHPSNTMFCSSSVFISGLSEDQVPQFLTALRSLGARIDKFQIVRHKVNCYNCGPAL